MPTPKRFCFTCCGNETRPEYHTKVEKDGTITFDIVGQVNIQAEIQSHAKSCDITNIMQRYALGDTTVLSKVQGVYGDFTVVPKTYADVLQRVIDAKSMFDQLPIESRGLYGMDFNKFFADVGSPTWLKACGLVSSSESSGVTEPEVAKE